MGKRTIFYSTLLFCISAATGCGAQQYDTASAFALPVQLDSFIVKSGFDINAFVRRVRTDTTFYKAFRNMRFVPYSSVNDIAIYDKHNQVAASQHSTTRQHIDNHCRSTELLEQHTTGDFLSRKGDYNYYTAELFAYLFFTKGRVCNEREWVGDYLTEQGSGQDEQRKYQLKQLIFNPGSKVSGIPFMGDRASIFDEDEAGKYDFRIMREMYGGQECYVFRILPKPGYERKVIYNELTTWFRKSDYSILARDYSLSYSTLVYDFNVRMRVRTKEIGKKLYPTSIDYDGNWHVFTRKRERVRFSVVVTY